MQLYKAIIQSEYFQLGKKRPFCESNVKLLTKIAPHGDISPLIAQRAQFTYVN